MNPDRQQKRSIGFTGLKKWLRHRHPMLMIDRILDYEPGHFLTARMVVSGALDCFAGHFPERAVYPGSHLIQAFAQTGIILCQLGTEPLADDEMTLISSVEAKFFKIIVPGDAVELHTRLDRCVKNTFFVAGEAIVDGVRVAAFRNTLIRTPLAQIDTHLC